MPPKYVRHVFKALAEDDVEGLLQRMRVSDSGLLVPQYSFFSKISMNVVPMVAVDDAGRVRMPIRYRYKDNPADNYRFRIAKSFGLGNWQYPDPNMWDFWQDIPPTEGFFTGAVKASYRLAKGSDVKIWEIRFLLDFIGRPLNHHFYNDAMIGGFLEEKIVESLKMIDKDEDIAAWARYASALIKLMPFERRIRVFKAVSADYTAEAGKASGGLPLGPISDIMGEAALGMNSLEELEIALPIINLVSSRLNVDIPSNDPGFTGIITGMAGVIGMLDEEKQVDIIGRVFDESMVALRGGTLNLFDRLFEPKEGETRHAADFARRVGMRLARSKATNYAHLFLGAYADSLDDNSFEKRFDHAQEMALGAVQAFMGKDAVMTERDLQLVVFTISNNILFKGPQTPEFAVDRFSSWLASLGKVGNPVLLFAGIRPLIQLIQSDELPTERWNSYTIENRIELMVPNLAKIAETILKNGRLTSENRAVLAGRLKAAAESCVAEKWETTVELKETSLAEQCRLIKDICDKVISGDDNSRR